MKTIIAGSRCIDDYNLLLDVIKTSGFKITEVISGGMRGVGRLSERYAKENNIKLTQIIPDQDHKNSAGILNNIEMAKIGNQLIAIWDGNSSDTQHMISEAKKRGLPIHVHVLNEV